MNKMSMCELCKAAAMIYCDSDRALLCWNCDARVHSANFLVARHFRNLLCHLCHSPTTWNASGSTLSPGMSICVRCTKITTTIQSENMDIASGNDCMEEVIDENGDEDRLITTTRSTTDVDDDDDDDDDDGENQVAPCSYVPVPPPPTTTTTEQSFFSSSQGSSRRFWNCDPPDSLKRGRGNNYPDLKSHDDDDDDNDSGMSELSSRALKVQRVDTYEEEEEEEEESDSKSATMMESVIEEQKVSKVADDDDGGHRLEA